MKKNILFLCFFIFCSQAGVCATTAIAPQADNQPQLINALKQGKTREFLEQKKGKKLSFKERIIVKTLEKKAQKALNSAKKKDDRKTHWANIVGLICGIIAFFFGYLAIPAVVFGAIGMSKAGKNKKFKGKGMGIAGLVLGILGLLVYIAVIAAL